MRAIGIDVGGTNINAGVILDGKQENIISERTNRKGQVDEVVPQIYTLIDRLIDNKILGIGIGVPSIVSIKDGIIFETPNIPLWQEVPLKKLLEERYNLPTFVNNDANCFALGERYFGKGRSYRNFAACTLGTGFGTGIVINGELFSGSYCNVGDFGGVTFKDKTVDYYCSGEFFQKEFGMHGKEVFEKAEQGEKEALQIFEEFGHNLGKGLTMPIRSFDLDAVILGGAVSKAYKFFKDTMQISLEESNYKRIYSKVKVEVSDIENIQVIGAAALCRESLK